MFLNMNSACCSAVVQYLWGNSYCSVRVSIKILVQFTDWDTDLKCTLDFSTSGYIFLVNRVLSRIISAIFGY